MPTYRTLPSRDKSTTGIRNAYTVSFDIGTVNDPEVSHKYEYSNMSTVYGDQ